MNVGDEIIIKAKVVDFDNNPHGAYVKVEIDGFMNSGDMDIMEPFQGPIMFWIHRVDISDIIREENK